MLVLARKYNEKIVIPEFGIELVVVEVRGDTTRIGIEVDRSVEVHRGEIWDVIKESDPARVAEIQKKRELRGIG